MFDIASPLTPDELTFQTKEGLHDAPPEQVRIEIIVKVAKLHRLPPAAATDAELTDRYHRCLASHKTPCHDFGGAKACLDEERRLEIISRHVAVAKAAGTVTGRVM